MAPADPDQGKGKGRIVGLAEKLVALGQAGHTVKIVQVMVGGPRAEVVVEPRERPVPAPADLEQSPKNAGGDDELAPVTVGSGNVSASSGQYPRPPSA